MKRHVLFAAGLLMASSELQGQIGLQGQMERAAGVTFQLSAADSEANIKILAMEQLNGPTVTGRPFAGTEERHTLQLLADGTRIEKTETDRLFRDERGRVRMERPDGVVVVHDPILGITVETNTSNKDPGRVTVQSRRKTEGGSSDQKNAQWRAWAQADVTEIIDKAWAETLQQAKVKAPRAVVEENLGAASMNGIVAQGSRQTTIIESGQIGNDRPIRIVSERWYSNELQMLVKSSNSDPRFGETTYQLMNVSLAAPDPGLFRIPAEHKVGGQ